MKTITKINERKGNKKKTEKDDKYKVRKTNKIENKKGNKKKQRIRTANKRLRRLTKIKRRRKKKIIIMIIRRRKNRRGEAKVGGEEN